MLIYETEDCTGRRIYLSHERWAHINQEHPEILLYRYALEDTLKNPTTIVSYSKDKKVNYYYKFIKEKKSYLLLIVKYLNGTGFIITAYLTRSIR